MIGYFDPTTLSIERDQARIIFASAADHTKVMQIIMKTAAQVNAVITAIEDQITHGVTGYEGRMLKVQGQFTRLPDSINEGIITPIAGSEKYPVRLNFDAAPGDLPDRGLCVAIGEMVDGTLLIERITIEPLVAMPTPTSSIELNA